jgi:hypothetical protein
MAAASPEDMAGLAAEAARTEAEDPAAVLRTAAEARVAERRVAARTEEVAAEVRVEAVPVQPVPVHLVQVEAATANLAFHIMANLSPAAVHSRPRVFSQTL